MMFHLTTSMTEDILQFDSEESEVNGYFTILKQQKAIKYGPLDRQLQQLRIENKQSDVQKPEQDLPQVNVINQLARKSQSNNVTLPVLDIDPFTGQPIVSEAIADEAVVVSQQKKKIDKITANHLMFRPRIVIGALQSRSIAKLGQIQGFTDEELRDYVEKQDGQLFLSHSKNATNIIKGMNAPANLESEAKHYIQMVYTEEQFYDKIVAWQSEALQKQYSLNKLKYPHIPDANQIDTQLRKMNWVVHEQCMNPISLKEIDQIFQIEVGEAPAQPVAKLRAVIAPPKLDLKPKVPEKPISKPAVAKPVAKPFVPSADTPVLVADRPAVVRDSAATRLSMMPIAMRHRPQTLFEIESAQTKLITKALQENKVVIVTGAVGCGKSTVVRIAAAEQNFVVTAGASFVASRDALATQSLNGQKKCVVVDDCEEVDKLLEIIRTARGQNRLILITSDISHQKLKTAKRGLAEVRMPKADVGAALLTVYRREKQLNPYFRAVPVQNVQQVIDAIQQRCGNDLRQAITQFEYVLGTTQQTSMVNTPPSPAELAQAVFNGKIYTLEQFFADPLAHHYLMVQNYTEKAAYQYRLCKYYSDLFSEADVIMGHMYHKGDWQAAKAAQTLETSQVSIQMIAKMATTSAVQPPFTIYSAKERAVDINFCQDQLFESFENRSCLEIGMKILDASFFCGLSAEDQTEQKLCMELGSSVADAIELFGLQYCTGKKKSDLLSWSSAQDEFSGENKKKKAKM